MEFITNPSLPVSLAILCPLLPLLLGVIPSSTANRLGRHAALISARLALLAFGFAVLAASSLVVNGPSSVTLLEFASFKVSIHLDALSAVMLLLVTFLSAIVTRYSINYMAGEPGQGRFSKWLSLTSGSVLLLILSGNFLLLTIAWVATSMSLHKLLTFYPDRPAAILAASKKFIVSRLGDACLAGALVLTWQCFGTWEFQELFAATARIDGAISQACTTSISVLIVAGALMKSAQFPFHSWLPDTLEIPTPVSALMHAGIINAGGYLVVRLSPMILLSPTSLNVLALVGAFTALFASVIMLTQTSIKRSLAWSTISQMGFMMLQCGLGAFALAVLHIVAHSLYKAHAFLSSGNIVSMTRASWVPVNRPATHPLTLLGGLAVAVTVTWAAASLAGLDLLGNAGELLLSAIFAIALAHLLWTLWDGTMPPMIFGLGVAIAGSAAAACFGLHRCFEHLLAGSLPTFSPDRTFGETLIMGLVVVLFMAVLVFQSQLPQWHSRPALRRFYVHASNGFYVGTLFGRLTRKLSSL